MRCRGYGRCGGDDKWLRPHVRPLLPCGPLCARSGVISPTPPPAGNPALRPSACDRAACAGEACRCGAAVSLAQAGVPTVSARGSASTGLRLGVAPKVASLAPVLQGTTSPSGGLRPWSPPGRGWRSVSPVLLRTAYEMRVAVRRATRLLWGRGSHLDRAVCRGDGSPVSSQGGMECSVQDVARGCWWRSRRPGRTRRAAGPLPAARISGCATSARPGWPRSPASRRRWRVWSACCGIVNVRMGRMYRPQPCGGRGLVCRGTVAGDAAAHEQRGADRIAGTVW